MCSKGKPLTGTERAAASVGATVLFILSLGQCVLIYKWLGPQICEKAVLAALILGLGLLLATMVAWALLDDDLDYP